MFITSREKNIIHLIMKTSGKHSAQSLASFLNVSVRTVQRDLRAVEKILNQFDLVLSRTSSDGLIVEGKNEQVFKLMQNLKDVQPTDETPEEKKLQLLIILFHQGNSFKTQVLSKQLGVSITTLAIYLDDLTNWCENYGISLTRKRGVGVEILGEEMSKRKALANYFLAYFHEELIDSIYSIQKGNLPKNRILGFFTPNYLYKIDQLFSNTINSNQISLADSDYIGLVIHICITIQRIEAHFLLKDEIDSKIEHISEYQVMKHLCNQLQNTVSIPIAKNDIRYVTVILRGAKLQNSNSIDYDRILLVQKIKSMIQRVSKEIQVDLTKEFPLFQGLFSHIERSIFRLNQQMRVYNPLTGEIKSKYPVLFKVVKNSLIQEFEDIMFQDDEIAFIVLHFGSAMLMNETQKDIQAVVVCPTGIGTSKMLASRLQKEVTEISSVEIKSIKDFELVNPDDYDVILSTVRLPFPEVDYVIVTPLLSEEDVMMVRSFLHKNQQGNKEKRTLRKTTIEHSKVSKGDQKDLQIILQEMKDTQKSIEDLLRNLRVYRKINVTSHIHVMKEMVDKATQENLVGDADRVLQKLKERENKGGLGIPKTNMGLYHCRDESIHQLIFQISHIDNPSYVKGMDGQEVLMKNLLLMLAPENLRLREQEILSLISTSLIENEVSIMIYSSSNEDLIRKKLEDLFLGYLQNNVIKD